MERQIISKSGITRCPFCNALNEVTKNLRVLKACKHLVRNGVLWNGKCTMTFEEKRESFEGEKVSA